MYNIFQKMGCFFNLFPQKMLDEKKLRTLTFLFPSHSIGNKKKPRRVSGLFLMLSYLDLLLLLCKILSKVGQDHFGTCALDRNQHLVHAAVVV